MPAVAMAMARQGRSGGMVYANDSKSFGGNPLRVQVSPPAQQHMHKVLVIVGPTASGKSGLAVDLAKKLDGEVVSADSRQVYRGLDIGSGKVTKREMKNIPHFMLDVASPKKVFTASDYIYRGRKIIDDICARGKLPIICGGTGFYIDTLVGRILMPDVEPDMPLRYELEKLTTAELFSQLEAIDPIRAKNIDKHNPRRLVRAIEIAKAIGKSPVADVGLIYQTQWIGINPDLGILDKKIHDRLLSRIKQGMLNEAKQLHAAGLSWKRMEKLGLEYRYLALYLQGKYTKKEMLEELEMRIRQYARRQITYWKRNHEIKWFTSPAEALRSF